MNGNEQDDQATEILSKILLQIETIQSKCLANNNPHKFIFIAVHYSKNTVEYVA